MVQRDLLLLDPLAIGLARPQLFLDLLIRDDALLAQVAQQHLARLQAALELDVFRLHRQHAGFRRHDEQSVVRYHVSRRAQSVAVQRSADNLAVGERDRSRAVPRLHQRGVIFVEGLLGRIHGHVVIPGFRNHHGHRVRHFAAGPPEQFHGVVEFCRVAPACHLDRRQLLDVVSEERRLEHILAGVHPISVALNGVDLAVVADEAERVRQIPGGERIGGKALVDQA